MRDARAGIFIALSLFGILFMTFVLGGGSSIYGT